MKGEANSSSPEGDNFFRIDLSESLYSALNDIVQASFGMDFEPFARKNPKDAYEMLVTLSESMVMTSRVAQVEHNGVSASSKMDGIAATRGMALTGMESSRTDTDIEPIDVIVSVVRKPALMDRIRSRQKSDVVTKFRVEPPDLVNY